jgi:hypothetical protein
VTITGNKDGSNPTLTTKFAWSGFYKKHQLQVTKSDELTNQYKKYKDLIKNINLYVSKPITRYPIKKDSVTVSGMGWEDAELTTLKVISIPEQYVEFTGIEKALLYKQKSWTFEEFCNGIYYTMRFGGDEQTTGATMEVYGSNTDRAGEMFTYNKKVHFFNSKARLNLNIGDTKYVPYKSMSDSGYATNYEATATALVYVKNGNEDLIFRYDGCKVILANTSYDSTYRLVLPDMMVIEDSRVSRVEFIIRSIKSDIVINELINIKFSVNFSASPAYNYAYYFGGPTGEVKSISKFDGIYPILVDTYHETDVINVSDNGAPFIFPVAYSYKFDGNITALAVAMQQISDAQVGQYPVNVFTDNGIYALQQGSGAVLYSNIIPLTGDTCINPSICYTSQGIAYISNGAVYILNGRNATKMSLLLEGQPDTYIQNNQSFLKCCGNSLYDISSFLSSADFREYVNDAKLSWCANTNELIVSNKAYPYSYVYDFVYNSWYKVSGTYEGVEDNLILKPVTLNNGSASPASATVTLSALHVEPTKQISVLSKATYPTTLSCGAGNNIALLIDDTQVASAVFSQITYTPMMVSVLCESIGYLEDEPGTIYSKTDLAAKSIRLYNISTGAEIFSSTFTATSESKEIKDKAIGAVVSLKVGTNTYTEPFLASSSAVTLLNNLADKVNATDTNVFATVNGNKITLTAKTAGEQGNNINISVSSTDANYIYISTTQMTGGQDISLKPSAYKEIVDWSIDNQGAQQMIHLHTRPMLIDNPNGYKTIRRAVLNCIAQLKGKQNLSLYIYASNDLIDWKCVAAAQRKDCDIAQITTDRTAKAYKYFVFMIGGIVSNNTNLGHITLAVEDVVNNKLR